MSSRIMNINLALNADWITGPLMPWEKDLIAKRKALKKTQKKLK